MHRVKHRPTINEHYIVVAFLVCFFQPTEGGVPVIADLNFDAAGATALMIGATGIGLAPILVRLSETGPVATAFYRLLLAQPIVWWLLKLF